MTVQLVNGATDGHLWAESYERDLGDVPALLDEVAGTIAGAIRVAVSPDERRLLVGRGRVDPEAYETGLRAVHALCKYTPADTDRAIALLEESVARDPSFALAYAVLGGACVIRAVPFGVALSVEEQHRLMERARAAAERAVQLDQGLALAYSALGAVIYLQDLDPRAARDVLEHAIRLEPSCSQARVQRAMASACLLEHDVARREAQLAVELDPLNLGLRSQCAEVRYWIRDYDAAIEGALDTLAFDPAFPRAHFVLGRVYEAQARIPEALDHYCKAGVLSRPLAAAARSAFAKGGVVGFHRWALQVGFGGHGGPTAGTGSPLRAIWKAKLHCQAGDVEAAIAGLEQAYAERDALLMLLNVDTWDPLRADPRFQDLVRRLGLPSPAPETAGSRA